MGQQASEVSKVWREAVADERGWKPEEWIDEGEVRKEATRAVGRAKHPEQRPPSPIDGRRRKPPPTDPELAKIVGPDRAQRFTERLKSAADHFQRGRYDDARKILRPLSDAAPTSESLRELYGLTLYRLGKWRQAAAELESFRALSDSTEQHPVLADCYRALGRHQQVESLWEELRTASPSAELVAEGRIVMAGSLADQDRLEDAIRLLQRAKLPSRRPREHHLRVAYALADLYERAGETPKARELFMIVATTDNGFADVRERLRNLS
jgi:tetratricopeptide (TPR) repeat protein